MDAALTLNETLKQKGYTTKPAQNRRKIVLLGGWQVFVGTAHETWQWLMQDEPEAK